MNYGRKMINHGWLMLNDELWPMNNEICISNYELCIMNYELRIEIMNYALWIIIRIINYELWIIICYELWAMNYEIINKELWIMYNELWIAKDIQMLRNEWNLKLRRNTSEHEPFNRLFPHSSKSFKMC